MLLGGMYLGLFWASLPCAGKKGSDDGWQHCCQASFKGHSASFPKKRPWHIMSHPVGSRRTDMQENNGPPTASMCFTWKSAIKMPSFVSCRGMSPCLIGLEKYGKPHQRMRRRVLHGDHETFGLLFVVVSRTLDMQHIATSWRWAVDGLICQIFQNALFLGMPAQSKWPCVC